MIQIIPSEQRHRVQAGWLDARWHFSFSDYHDPDNVSFGPLRVFNDDVVQPDSGFDMHPHRDMEIVTYVISGALEHRDHLGHRGVLRPGEVQVMSAGRGIMHSEKNPSHDEPVRLNQIWILPRHRGNQPRYEQKSFAPEHRRGRLLPVVTSTEAAGKQVPGALAIDQDATIYVSTLGPGQGVTHNVAPGRRAYVFVINGPGVTLNAQALHAGDQARLTDEHELRIRADETATADTELMLIDLP